MLGGVAELLSIDPELLDDLKTSVSEACNNVVLHAYDGEPGPMEVGLFVTDDRFSVRVSDEGVGMPAPPPAGDVSQGIGLSVIRALTEDVQFSSAPGGGTEVRMDFSVRRDGRKLFEAPPAAAGDADMTPSKDGEGEVIVSLSPVTLLPGVLGPAGAHAGGHRPLLARPLLRRLSRDRHLGGSRLHRRGGAADRSAP